MKLLRDVAIRHLVTIDPTDNLRRASEVMTDRGVGCAVVMEKEQIAGIITERDILHAVAGKQNVDETSVASAMTKEVVSGAPGWDIIRAVNTMTEGGFRHLLICEMNDPIGIVSLRDLMDSMAELARNDGHVSN